MGLLDAGQLKENNPLKNTATTKSSRGEVLGFAGSTRPQRGVIAELENVLQAINGKAFAESSPSALKNAHQGV